MIWALKRCHFVESKFSPVARSQIPLDKEAAVPTSRLWRTPLNLEVSQCSISSSNPASLVTDSLTRVRDSDARDQAVDFFVSRRRSFFPEAFFTLVPYRDHQSPSARLVATFASLISMASMRRCPRRASFRRGNRVKPFIRTSGLPASIAPSLVRGSSGSHETVRRNSGPDAALELNRRASGLTIQESAGRKRNIEPASFTAFFQTSVHSPQITRLIKL